jgi:hypothetical protein
LDGHRNRFPSQCKTLPINIRLNISIKWQYFHTKMYIIIVLELLQTGRYHFLKIFHLTNGNMMFFKQQKYSEDNSCTGTIQI